LITQKELKESLHYNPETGVFVWLASPHGKVNAGDIAGFTDKTTGYIKITVNSKKNYAHRLAWLYMTGEWPEDQIDHDDRVRANNKWDNLFAATNQENNKNKSKQKNNTSGVTGVSWFARDKIWRARVTINDKEKHLGYFVDKFEAVCARMSANNKYDFHENHGV